MEIYKTALGTLHNADALALLNNINDGAVNLILTDPPYNVSNNTKIVRNGGKYGKAKDINLNFGEWDWGNIEWRDYIDEFVRVLDDNGVLVMFYDRLWLGVIGLYLRDVHGFKIRHIGTAVKRNPAPQARKVQWQVGTEMFIVATKNQRSGHHFNYQLGQSPDYYLHSVNYKHYHPTQKHEGLIEWIMKYWSYEGDLVLDPFVGSGTTAVVAERINRRWIAGDINDEYLNIAVERLKKIENNEVWL